MQGYHRRTQLSVLFLLISALFYSCGSYKQFRYVAEEFEIPRKIFRTNYATTWLAAIKVMRRYDLQTQNQATGVIKTQWQDNTRQLNFSDSFGSSDAIKSARFKVILNIIKGFRRGREVTSVTVFKRQMVEQDFMQGQKVVPSDGILEKQILYRIARVLAIEEHLKKIDEVSQREEQEQGL